MAKTLQKRGVSVKSRRQDDETAQVGNDKFLSKEQLLFKSHVSPATHQLMFDEGDLVAKPRKRLVDGTTREYMQKLHYACL
jgi:hypothetical protein